MNAAVRTLAVAGRARGHDPVGIRRGWEGLLAGETVPLDEARVQGISRLGGTILGSSRSARFPTPGGQALAHEKVRALGIEALVVIGGNGSLAGAHLLGEDRPCSVIGLPASIDNDIGHTSLSIGVDTAVNTTVEACDRISDTARAHQRAFVVEVMGRDCGFLAMRAGIAAEADAILYGERHFGEDDLIAHLRGVLRRCFAPGRAKNRALIIKSESVKVPTAAIVARLQEHLHEDAPGVDIRATILGHVLRGGAPSALDRVIAQRLAFRALLACEAGAHDAMMAWEPHGPAGEPTQDPSVRSVPIGDVLAETACLLDGTSPVTRARVAMLQQVEELLAL